MRVLATLSTQMVGAGHKRENVPRQDTPTPLFWGNLEIWLPQICGHLQTDASLTTEVSTKQLMYV